MLPVTFMPPARKYFKKLKDKELKRKYEDAIIRIRMEPEIGELKTGDLLGISSYDVYHNRTNYELAYRLEENENGEIVVVIMAGTRENFYEELKRYMD